MKMEIDPTDIRKGDLIRFEWDDESASEWRESVRRPIRPGTYYLLDRPKPAVELPTVPTLGWASFSVIMRGLPETELGVWERRTFDNGNDTFRSVAAHNVSQAQRVTAFTHATAVPTEALDELRERYVRGEEQYGVNRAAWHRNTLNDFLAEVDAANGSSK